jgi:glycosyltransferase involved in cell wall biosynthesis
MRKRPRIAIDSTHIEALNVSNGQYRCFVNLIQGLHHLSPDADFLLLGSREKPLPELTPLFDSNAGPWHYRQIHRPTARGSYYWMLVKYWPILKHEQIDLLHSLQGLPPLLAPCPIIITGYDLMFELFTEYREATRSRPYRIEKWIIKHVVRRIIAISKTTADDFQRLWGIDRSKIDIVYLGTDFLEESAASHITGCSSSAESGFTIVSPYNLEPRKNLSSLLRAFATVIRDVPNTKLVLFGRAAWTVDREAEHESLINQLGIESQVVRTGFVEDIELRKMYADSSVFVFPTLYEGFGLPLLEAMACGACVVSRGVSAMAEVVGDAGTLVDTTDVNALAKAITGLLLDPVKRAEFSAAAIRRASSFTIERMASQTFESYMRVLSQRAG